MNSIEFLQDAAGSPSTLQWRLIDISATILAPRDTAGAVAIDSSNIAIFGGFADDGDEISEAGDLVLFNTDSQTGKLAVPNMEGLLQFACEDN